MMPSLKQLHPLPHRNHVVASAVVFGIVIALFLILLQPFGLEQVHGGARKIAILAGYGAITFAVVAANGVLLPSLLPKIYTQEKWTLGRDLFYTGFVNFAAIAVLNYIYSVWAFHFATSLGGALFSLFATVTVGFLPFVILVLIRHNRLLKSNLNAAAEMNAAITGHAPPPALSASKPAAGKPITLLSDSAYDSITFSVDDLLYAESADNYIKVVTVHEGTARIALLRQTLKGLEDSVAGYGQVIRCHRSFVVNLDKMLSVSGNAQGLRLSLQGTDAIIPVSRSMARKVKELLNSPS